MSSFFKRFFSKPPRTTFEGLRDGYGTIDAVVRTTKAVYAVGTLGPAAAARAALQSFTQDTDLAILKDKVNMLVDRNLPQVLPLHFNAVLFARSQKLAFGYTLIPFNNALIISQTNFFYFFYFFKIWVFGVVSNMVSSTIRQNISIKMVISRFAYINAYINSF